MKSADNLTEVLVVEDDPAHAEAITRSLSTSKSPVNIRVANSIAQFRELAALLQPDIVFMDLNLPDGLAADLLDKADKPFPFPILVMTNHGTEQTAVKVIKAGAIDYLIKSPEMFADMPRTVDRALREWNLREARIRAEEQTKMVIEQFHTIFDNVQAGIFIIDPESNIIVNSNLTAARMCGVAPGDIIGKTRDKYTTDPKHGAGSHHGAESIECDLITASGPRIPVLKTSVPITIRGSHFILESMVDISKRKQTERELHKTNQSLEKSMEELKHTREQTLRNERMNALAQMVSGIAHDFNNILMPILGLSDLLLQYPEETKNRSEVRKTLRIINSAAKDGSEIVRRLREFYKPSETPTTAPVDLVVLVKRALELTAPAWKSKAQADGRNIKIRTRIAKIPPIPGNAAQLREVLTNLIINAVDAMPTGGSITIAMKKKGAAILISVTDTGVGMSPETCKQCLEPFFTSKHTQGSGLGLSLCHGIITRHHGKFKIQSKLGIGTTITISLPLRARTRSAKTPHSGSARKLSILLAEDENDSLNLITRYLHLSGHTVETVTNGLKALERMKTSTFDLLITDKAMPQMNGNALAKEAKKAYPDIVVIMLTGFGDFMQLTSDEQANIDLLLRKPLTKKDLIDAIESLFAG